MSPKISVSFVVSQEEVGGDMTKMDLHLRAWGFIEPSFADFSDEKRYYPPPLKGARLRGLEKRPMLLVRTLPARENPPEYLAKYCKSYSLLGGAPSLSRRMSWITRCLSLFGW
jgi:hypothetical protein